MAKKIFLIACEASGDSHAAHLLEELKKHDPFLECRGLGGPELAKQGMTLSYDMTTISSLGLGDVLRQYFTYRKIFYNALNEVKAWKPDAVILVDSPGFNLRFAKKLRGFSQELPIFYYICPQIWAWGQRRVHVVKKTITKLFSILPFEVDFYKKHKIECEFVGHPLMDHPEVKQSREALREYYHIPKDAKAVGLLPGSRKKEVTRIFPTMLKAAKILKDEMPEIKLYVSKSANVDHELYADLIKTHDVEVEIFETDFSKTVAAFDFALVTSGTATLQTALAGTPFFLLYRADLLTYFLGRQLIKVPFLGLVNLLAGKSVIPEFIQWKAKPKTIAHEARVLLKNEQVSNKMREEFQIIKERLGGKGASANAAQAMINYLSPPNAPTQTQAQTPVRN